LSHYQGADELNFIITEHATAHEVRQACSGQLPCEGPVENTQVEILAGAYDDNRFGR
jgi:hypothetical protein